MAYPQALSILFDLDGTLIDSAPGVAWSLNKALEAEGRAALSVDRVKDLVGKGAVYLVADALKDTYGRTTYGQSCLLARRLVERGVKFVNVYFSSSIGGQSKTSGGWDTHGFNDTRMYPILDAWQLPMT